MNQSRLYLTARKPEAWHINSILEQRLEDEGVPISLFEDETGGGNWAVSIYVETREADQWRSKISTLLGSDAFGLEIQQEDFDDINWVEHTLSELVPVRAGRFIVHGSHDRHVPKPHQIAIEVDAGLAFGTGHHGTTAGCLDMIEKCMRQRNYAHVLDLGTGSGVLAIGLAKLLKIPLETLTPPTPCRIFGDDDLNQLSLGEDQAHLNVTLPLAHKSNRVHNAP